MVHPLAASDRQKPAFCSDRPQSRSAMVFGVGFAVAAVLTLTATVLLLSGDGLANGGNPLIRWPADQPASSSRRALAGILAHRIVRIARAWAAAATGARLHVRFVTLFSLAAMRPR